MVDRAGGVFHSLVLWPMAVGSVWVSHAGRDEELPKLRGRRVSEFEANLVCIAGSRTAKAT